MRGSRAFSGTTLSFRTATGGSSLGGDFPGWTEVLVRLGLDDTRSIMLVADLLSAGTETRFGADLPG